MTVDPILERIAREDEDLFLRVVDALISLGGDGVRALAGVEGLPPSRIRKLLTTDESVRSALAMRRDCPADVWLALARDPESRVRASLAQNPHCPSEVLLALAGDESANVRYFVFKNVRASDEHRAAIALMGLPETTTPAKSDEAANPDTSPERLRALVAQYAKAPQEYGQRSSLAQNPSLPEDCIPTLIEAATYRWEWQALWRRKTGLWSSSAVWPSTFAFTQPETPAWVRDALAEYGHPAALICISPSHAEVSSPPETALAQLITSELLVRALWRELALTGAVELIYWNDNHEGDQFFPSSPNVELISGNTPAQYILGGYSPNREWIQNTDYLTDDARMRVAAQSFEGDMGDIGVDFTPDELDYFTLSGAAHIAEGYTTFQGSATFTEAGRAALKDLVESGMGYFDREDMDTEVAVVESTLPNIGYAATSTEQKVALIGMLAATRKDPLFAQWGISRHFLMCIALHPDTPDEVRATLLDDPDPDVQHAAQVSMGGTQRTASGKRQMHAGARINTFVFSTLIPEGRFEEARIWLSQCIEFETGYEVWNSLSNLGIVEFLTGHTDRARTLFEMVLASGDGPAFEAEDYLERINRSERHPMTPTLTYSDAWRTFPIDGVIPADDQQGHYLRILNVLADSNLDEALRHAWQEGRGDYVVGFLDSALATEGILETGVTRETVARGLRDYTERVVLELPPADEPYRYDDLSALADQDDRGPLLIRRAAAAGNPEAAQLLGTNLIAAGETSQGQAWLKVAEHLAHSNAGHVIIERGQ